MFRIFEYIYILITNKAKKDKLPFFSTSFYVDLFIYRYETLNVVGQKQSKSLGDLLEMVSEKKNMLSISLSINK